MMAPETEVVMEQDETGQLPRSDEAVAETSEIEAKARRMGWTDQDEFRGHPDRWVDAETYVARADEHLPILKGTVASMNKKMEAQEQLILEQNTRIKEMQADFKEFVGFTRKAEERAYAKALEQLKAEQRQAVEDQDMAKFDGVSAEIDQHLKNNPADQAAQAKPAAEPAAPAQIFSQAVFDAWLAENTWYGERPKMALYAQQLDRWLAENKPTLSQAKRLAEIAKLVREEYPDYWDVPGAPGQRRKGGSPVEGADGGGAVVREGKKTYANLPAEAKAACDRFCGKDGKGTAGTIPGYTRENYLNDYDWSGE